MWKWFAAGVAAGWVLFDNPAGDALAAEVKRPGGLVQWLDSTTPPVRSGGDGGTVPFQKGIPLDGGKPGIGKGILIAV